MNLEDAQKLASLVPASLIPKLNEAFPDLSWRQEDYRVCVGAHAIAEQSPVTLKDGSRVDMSWDVATPDRTFEVKLDANIRSVVLSGGWEWLSAPTPMLSGNQEAVSQSIHQQQCAALQAAASAQQAAAHSSSAQWTDTMRVRWSAPESPNTWGPVADDDKAG